MRLGILIINHKVLWNNFNGKTLIGRLDCAVHISWKKNKKEEKKRKSFSTAHEINGVFGSQVRILRQLATAKTDFEIREAVII